MLGPRHEWRDEAVRARCTGFAIRPGFPAGMEVPRPVFSARTNNPLIGGVVVKVRTSIACGPFADGVTFEPPTLTVRQVSGDRIARGSAYWARGELVCDGVRHPYVRYIYPEGEDPARFHAGEAVAARSFHICGPDPGSGQYVCETNTWSPKVITIYVPSA